MDPTRGVGPFSAAAMAPTPTPFTPRLEMRDITAPADFRGTKVIVGVMGGGAWGAISEVISSGSVASFGANQVFGHKSGDSTTWIYGIQPPQDGNIERWAHDKYVEILREASRRATTAAPFMISLPLLGTGNLGLSVKTSIDAFYHAWQFVDRESSLAGKVFPCLVDRERAKCDEIYGILNPPAPGPKR